MLTNPRCGENDLQSHLMESYNYILGIIAEETYLHGANVRPFTPRFYTPPHHW